jgi:hypothetical protein
MHRQYPEIGMCPFTKKETKMALFNTNPLAVGEPTVESTEATPAVTSSQILDLQPPPVDFVEDLLTECPCYGPPEACEAGYHLFIL